MNKETSHLRRKVEENLMKRYAVEKILRLRDILKACALAVASFVLFLGFWYLYLNIEPEFKVLKILLVAGALVVIGGIWWALFRMVGKIIPKFVLIGMLGWILMTIGLVPNFFTGGDFQKITSSPASRLLHTDIINVKDQQKSFHLPQKRWIDVAIAPALALKDADAMSQANGIVKFDLESVPYLFIRYLLLMMVAIFLFDILMTVSTHCRSDRVSRISEFYNIDARQRERDAKSKIILFSIILLALSLVSLNYFLMFWIVSFLAGIALFHWEILTQGQNHKPISRSVLFVILTQIFSSIFGEMLLILFLPMSGQQAIPQLKPLLLYLAILGWIIILGSAVTVLIGIITQVIWSGRRMTDHMRS